MKLSVSIPDELMARVDEQRGETPRSTFIQAALEEKLNPPVALSSIFPGPPPVPSARTVEQSLEGLRTGEDVVVRRPPAVPSGER